MTVTLDFATLGPVLLVLALSAVLGVAIGIAGFLLSGFGDLMFGMIAGITGDRSALTHESPKTPKGFVFLRAIIYVAICAAAIILSVHGQQGFAYLCAVAGGVTLPIATMKLFA